MSLTEKDIGNLSKGLSDNTLYNGRVIFGLSQTNLLKSAVHWVQYLQRISKEPTLHDIEDTSTFKERIDAAKVWAAIQNHNDDESDSLSKAAYPWNMKKQNQSIAWLRSIGNYLSIILGQNRVPLSYVILEKPYPKYD